MVDDLTRYYLRKQNLQAQDEFHDHIASKDMDQLNQATAYMLAAPIFTSALCYGYSKMRESGGASSHLAWAIASAKSKFTPTKWNSNSAATKTRWRSSKGGRDGHGHDGDEETPGMKFDPTVAADAYKQIKIDRQNTVEEKLRVNKERAQEILAAKNRGDSRGLVRNIDPFERERRREMRQ